MAWIPSEIFSLGLQFPWTYQQDYYLHFLIRISSMIIFQWHEVFDSTTGRYNFGTRAPSKAKVDDNAYSEMLKKKTKERLMKQATECVTPLIADAEGLCECQVLFYNFNLLLTFIFQNSCLPNLLIEKRQKMQW